MEKDNIKTTKKKEEVKKEKKLFILISAGVLTLILLTSGIIFVPKYRATKELALFISRYREEAEALTNQEQDNCNLEEERINVTLKSAGSLSKAISRQIELYKEESDCMTKHFLTRHLWAEDKSIQLQKIDLAKTKHEKEAKEIIDLLEFQKKFFNDNLLYWTEFYSNEKSFLNCKRSIILEQLTQDETHFIEGYGDSTVKQGIEECGKLYEEKMQASDKMFNALIDDSKEFVKVRDKTRKLTKMLNEVLNN